MLPSIQALRRRAHKIKLVSMNMKTLAKRHLFLLAALLSLPLASASANQSAADDKVSNSAQDLKAALRAAKLTSSTDDIAVDFNGTKIAALDTTEIKQALEQNHTDTTVTGDLTQGGLVIGKTQPGASVSLDGMVLDVDEAGRFIFGLGRDHSAEAVLEITLADGSVMPAKVLKISNRDFPEQRIDGLPSNKVNEFSP